VGVPLIDLRAARPADIDTALRGSGFFAVAGHGVPPDTVAAAFDASRRFFALDEGTKRRWHIDGWPLKRGFDPIGWQSLDPGQPPDVKESFYLDVEAIGPNQWPDEALVPGFRAALSAYAASMEALARRLMALFEQALGLPRGHFDGFMRHPTCTTRLLHYPPQPTDARPGQIGCGAHTDWGALTLLAQDDAGGLQVQTPAGDWNDVPPAEGAFVVNVGDMMQRWTNDRWPSTVHRVVNKDRPKGRAEDGRAPRGPGAEGDLGAPFSGRNRYSIAYFFDLDAESVIEPLASCVDATHPARYGPLTAGEHLAEMYRRTTVAVPT
jgi:isopenicillin N synthase-like dioxygenase